MTRSSLGLLHCLFGIFVPELWALIYEKKIPLIILRTSPNFIYAFILTRSRLGLLHALFSHIVTHPFSHICTRVMAFDLCQNFVSTQYLVLFGTIGGKKKSPKYETAKYSFEFSCTISNKCSHTLSMLVSVSSKKVEYVTM